LTSRNSEIYFPEDELFFFCLKSLVVVVFQNIFYSKIYKNNIFLFLKIIFDI
jgi:hypothetical protein